MKKIILVMIILLMIAAPVMANSEYTLQHDIEVKLDGDYNLGIGVYTPAQGGADISLEGIGQAYINSRLLIASVETVASNWWDLF